MALNKQAIGKHIRELRKKRNMSQDKLSELIDKSPTYMSYIECGAKNMNLETFVRIARFDENRIGIDCGSGYAEVPQSEYAFQGRLACLRLNDMQEFYSKETEMMLNGKKANSA